MRNMIGLGAFLLVWEAAVRLGAITHGTIPPPSEVMVRLVELFAQPAFWRDVAATMLAWVIAVSLAVAVAVPAGLLLGGVPAVRVATRVLIEFVRPLPPVALLPVVVMVLGSGLEGKVTLALLASVWPILFNTIAGWDELDPLWVQSARSFGLGRVAVLVRVGVPAVAPFAVTGLRVAATTALLVTVSTEYLAGSEEGIGAYLVETATVVDALDWVLAGAVALGIIGVLVNTALEWLGRALCGWSPILREAT